MQIKMSPLESGGLYECMHVFPRSVCINEDVYSISY